MQWAQLRGNEPYARVGATTVGPYWVSTTWLGLDHRRWGDGPPLIFETMAFPLGEHHEPVFGAPVEQRRYSTLEEAKAGHEEVCRILREGQPSS